jgi:hypothetical protein
LPASQPVAKSSRLNSPASGPVISVNTPAPKNARAELAGARAASPAIPNVVVEVKPGQTLRQISLGHFGWLDGELVEEIRTLNPRITDPNHIEPGQRIVLPGQTQRRPVTTSVGLVNDEPMTSARN